MPKVAKVVRVCARRHRNYIHTLSAHTHWILLNENIYYTVRRRRIFFGLALLLMAFVANMVDRTVGTKIERYSARSAERTQDDKQTQTAATNSYALVQRRVVRRVERRCARAREGERRGGGRVRAGATYIVGCDARARCQGGFTAGARVDR